MDNLVEVELQKIVSFGDKAEIHKLVIVVATTIIMLSNIEAGFQIFQDLLKVEDSELVEFGKDLTQNLVKVFTEFSGVQNEEPEQNTENFSPNPYRKVDIGGAISPLNRKHSDFSKNILEKYDESEKELFHLRKTQKEQSSRITDLETENQSLKSKLEKKTSELEKLAFENEDFKKRANIGMTEILELELNQKKEQVKLLTSKLEEKQKEYHRKIEDYHEKYDNNRKRINDLEEYRIKYEELRANQNQNQEGTQNQASDEELRAEYER